MKRLILSVAFTFSFISLVFAGNSSKTYMLFLSGIEDSVDDRYSECCYRIEDNSYLEKGSYSLERAVEWLYMVYEINKNPLEYIDRYTSFTKLEREEYSGFEDIDNYRIFLSPTSACNTDGEALCAFICRFVNDKAFRNQRIRLSTEQKHLLFQYLPTFKFYWGGDDEGATGVQSWRSIKKDSAIFDIGWWRSELLATFEFNRIGGKWYLTDFNYYE